MISIDDLCNPVFVTDADWRIVKVNHEMLSVLDLAEDDVKGQPLSSVFPPMSLVFIETHVRPMLLKTSEVREIFLQARHGDGSRVPVMTNCRLRSVDGSLMAVWSLFVTRERARFEEELLAARRRADQAAEHLAEQHNLLRITMDSIADGVITTDRHGGISWINPAAERLTGWTAEEGRTLPLDEVFRLDDVADPAYPAIGMTDESRFKRILSRAGETYDVEYSRAPILGSGDDMLGDVVVFRDVSEQRRLTGKIAFQATHDPLTGLFNRNALESNLTNLVAQCRSNGENHVLLFIDLDRFKLINDSCGHQAGDKLLRQVAGTLNECVRQSDSVARMGGDEFVVILTGCSAAKGQDIARQICKRLANFRFAHGDRQFSIGASIGLVTLDWRWQSGEQALQAADSACYAAKQAGRNRVEVWQPAMSDPDHEKSGLKVTAQLARSLDEGSLNLFVQRIAPLSLSESGFRGEILARLPAADGTLLAPGAFLPVAERFHLVTRIDRFMLSQTLKWMKAHAHGPDPVRLSVNLSGQSVSDASFREWAAGQLARAGRSILTRLTLEVTETVAISGLADASAFFDHARRAGASVALDDFGTGASSFSYLKSLPVDYLKIDGQFVTELATCQMDQAMVRCFRDVAAAMGIRTIAEYVDRQDNLDMLASIGVDYVQGYLIHKPEPLDGLVTTRSDPGEDVVRLDQTG